jgi:hypothetical protein
MTVQFKNEPALRAAMNLLSGGNPRLAWSRCAGLLVSSTALRWR